MKIDSQPVLHSHETHTLYTQLTYNFAVIVLVFSQESFRVVVGVYVNLCNGIVCGGFIDALMDARF